MTQTPISCRKNLSMLGQIIFAANFLFFSVSALADDSDQCGSPVSDVFFEDYCYYLDGSGGTCQEDYELAPQAVLASIAPLFLGKTYRTQVSSNCCIWHKNIEAEGEDWGFNGSCNNDGQFSDPPVLDGAACTDANNMEEEQLTLCGTKDAILGSAKHLCMLNDSNLYCWGNNARGQLGLGDSESRGDQGGEFGTLLPLDLGDFVPAGIYVKSSNTCALSREGKVKCWGENKHGQLGVGDRINRGIDAASKPKDVPAIDFGTNIRTETVALGGAHACALMANKSIRCWGANNRGQLGQGTTMDLGDDAAEQPAPVDLGAQTLAAALALGNRHSCALSDLGKVYCWGDGSFGQLGTGFTESLGSSPEQMGAHLTPVDLGANFHVASIAAGANHNCALSNTGRVKCWGHNHLGQLGVGDKRQRGGQPGEMGDALPVVDLGEGQIATQLACGSAHCCVSTLQRTMLCWGDNRYGQLGLGDALGRGDDPREMGEALPFVDLGRNFVVKDIFMGANYTCARDGVDRVKCWGQNDKGQLGLGDTRDRGGDLQSMPINLPFIVLPQSKR